MVFVDEVFDELDKVRPGQGGHLLLTLSKLEISHLPGSKYPPIKACTPFAVTYQSHPEYIQVSQYYVRGLSNKRTQGLID
jgi:hypothetical protein